MLIGMVFHVVFACGVLSQRKSQIPLILCGVKNPLHPLVHFDGLTVFRFAKQADKLVLVAS